MSPLSSNAFRSKISALEKLLFKLPHLILFTPFFFGMTVDMTDLSIFTRGGKKIIEAVFEFGYSL